MNGAVEMVPCVLNGRWPLVLPKHRAERAEWYDGGWERERLNSMYDLLQPGMTIIDVGAEEGDFPGLWASWGCHVAMIEPKAETWANIRVIWEANRFEPPVGLFVGFASDVTNLEPPRPYPPASGWVLDRDGWPLCSYGRVRADHGFAHLSQQADAIPQITLDDFAAECLGHVDAITIDVEGSELRVLHGAAQLLAFHRPLVWVSVHADRGWMVAEYGGADREDIDAWMLALDYEPTLLAVDHEMHVLYTPR